LRAIKKIILHVTDTPDSDMSWNADRLRSVHVNERGWKDIGYHFVIKRDGTLEKGRPVEEVGSHTLGENFDSIGIAWCGRNMLLDCQIKTLKLLITDLMTLYGLSVFDIHAHSEYTTEKTCPNVNINLIRIMLLSDFDILTLGKGGEVK
jgi:N-acetylmuramoyl-L-alanine amidase